VGFLRDIESPYEVKDYVRLYLGEGKEVQEFARQFLERRSKWRSAQRAAPLEDDMCVPAPAVNPLSTDFQEVKVSFFSFMCGCLVTPNSRQLYSTMHTWQHLLTDVYGTLICHRYNTN
jgi:hypothetical protein